MKNKIRSLKTKRYVATIVLVLLFVFVLGLTSILKPMLKNIKINSILSNTTSLNASVIDGTSEGIESNNYDEIKYQIKVDKENNDDEAIIIGTLTDKENKYARFKSTKEGVVTENGKKITVTTKKKKVTITVIIENAPYGTTINPKYKINSQDENKENINVQPVTITGKSVEGKVMDEKGTLYTGIELGLSSNGEEVKRTYTKTEGDYVFSLGDLNAYEVNIKEDKYKIVRYSEETTDENRRVLNVVIKEVEPFKLNIKKTISKLDLVVNGKKQTFNYNDETKVVKSLKNAKTIEGSIYYNISIKNEGEIKGTLTALKDVIPDGLSFDKDKNPGWTKEGNTLFYTVLEGQEIESFGKTSATLILDIKKTDTARTYINKAIANGEDYKYVVYYLNNQVYREEYVIANEKIKNINPGIDKFAGWYTDRNYTNRYDFDSEVTKDLVLFGKINDNKYTVTFIDINPNNNGETILDIVEVSEGESVDLVDHPEYRGYTFKCFELNNACYQDEPITDDVTIYTSYTVNDYEIVYNLDDGELESGKTNPDTYTVRDTFTLNNPSKEGYTFTGWTGTDLSEKTIDVTIPEGSIGDREYTATYEKIRSTLTIDPNGGTYENNASSVSYTEDYGTVKVISEPVRRGYDFLGYRHDGGGIYQNLLYTFRSEDGLLTAQYEIIPYSISYDNITPEERVFLDNPISYNVETETFTLKNPNTRIDDQGNNYQDFLGWDDGNGNVSLTVTIPKGSIGDRAYSAVWRENEDDYAITYELHDGEYETGKTNPSTYTRQTPTFILNNPGKTGYTFKGWSGTGLTGNENTTVTIEQGSSGDRTYEANYQVITYSITYDYDDGVLPAGVTNPTEYTIESDTINIANPSKEGYEFLGWSGTDIADKSTSVIIPHGSTGDRVYTANFKKIEYSLTYTLNGGQYETGKTNPDKYSIESPDITLNNPGKTGYTFKGWSGTDLTGDENTTVTIPHGSMGHRSFLAHYTPIEYNITYDYDGGALAEGVINPSKYTIETDDITFNTPSKEGYTFLNYTIDNVITTGIEKGSTEDKHVVAHYEIRHLTVNYYNEDTPYASETVDWGGHANKPLDDPTKAHNIFLYWAEDHINEFDFTNTIIKEDRNLYAVYEEVLPPVITLNPTLDDTTNRTWVCGDETNDTCGVTVTIENNPTLTDTTGYSIYYKIGDGATTLYTGPFKIYSNETITTFAEKSNISSENTTADIINVDTIVPTINQPSTGSMSFNITVRGVASDASSGVKQFTLYAKEKDALTWDDTKTYTSEIFDGIRDHSENYDHTFAVEHDDTEYVVKIVAEDYVGNISEREVEVKTNPYVARVVGKNGILWYTVDPDTKEFVFSTDYIPFDSIQMAVNYCAEMQCTIQTNPIYSTVNESVTIADNQNITIDLDGRIIASDEAATFVNNGELHIVDRNPRLNDQDGHESIGKVRNTVGKAVVNNGHFILGEGSEEPSPSFIYPELDRPIIEGYQAAVEQNNMFYFYDGKLVSDTIALITGNTGEEPITQYSYNVAITIEEEKKIGTLAIVDDPEARIKSTYYSKLKVTPGDNAFDSAKKGTMSTESAKILSKIKQYSGYGFVYDEVNDLIYAGNLSTINTTAISYVKLDLTDYLGKQFLMVDAFADTYNSNSYGYISISEEFGKTGTEVFRISGNDRITSRVINVDGGKVYYVYFGFVKAGGDINPDEIVKFSNFRILNEREEYSGIEFFNDLNNYSFTKQEDGSYKSSNNGIASSNAHSYVTFDTRNLTEEVKVYVNYTISSEANCDIGYMYLTDNDGFQAYNDSSNRIAYDHGSYTNTISFVLPAGVVKYLHFGYRKDHSGNTGTDSYKINWISFVNLSPSDTISESSMEHNESDTYYFNTIQAIKDLSNHGNDAIIYGATLNEQNNGLNFDGNDYVSIKAINNNEFTWYAKFKANATGGVIIANYENGGAGITIVDNKIRGQAYIDGAYRSIWSTEEIEFGRDYEAAITYKEGTLILYVDGVEQDRYEGTTITHPQSNTVLMLGANPGGSASQDSYLNGTIYKTKVYDRALTAAEAANVTSTEGLLVDFDINSNNIKTNSYISNNKDVNSSRAHSYIKYDLTNSNEDRYLYINTRISSENGCDFGIVQVTDSPDYPSDTSGTYIKVSNSYDNQSTVIKLPKNKVYYVHFIYTKDSSTHRNEDVFIIKDIDLYNSLEDVYSFNSGDYASNSNAYFEKPILNEKVDTVEILKPIILKTSIEVPQEKEVVLDLNGFTITSEKDDYIIKNNGKLTIIDSEYKDRIKQNVNYKLEQARLFEEAKARYLEDLTEYQEYSGTCDGCEPSDEYFLDNHEVIYDYTGKEEHYHIPKTGEYEIEIWGASGGSAYSLIGGYGGYSYAKANLTAGDDIYINVGGAGASTSSASYQVAKGGYNGGGNGFNSDRSSRYAGGGGGATSIAFDSGLLSTFESKLDKILMVAGGGAGSWYYNSSWNGLVPGHAGGYIANSGVSTHATGAGGTQDSGYAVGQAQNVANWESSGAGGGYYAGYSSTFCAGGGSGFINNDLLSDKSMYCYNCTEATNLETDAGIFTVSTTGSTEYTDMTNCPNGYSEEPVSKCAKKGSGYAKIKYIISDEELEEIRSNLTKTYNIKEEPKLRDYLDGIDFDSSVNLDDLAVDSIGTYNNVVEETIHGSITTTLANIILNEQYGTLKLETGSLNVNANSKYGVVNRGNLIIDSNFVINANNSSTTGIYNESNGEIIGGGTINAKGSSSIGLLNRSNTSSISNLNIVTSQTNAVGIYNQAIDDITYSNVNVTGSGIGFNEYAVANTTIINSNIKSTGNNAVNSVVTSLPVKLNITSSNINGTLSTDYSTRIVNVDNSTLTSVYNYLGYIVINNSSINSISNSGKIIVNESTLSGTGTLITNSSTNLGTGRYGSQTNSNLILKNSIINSNATSAVTVINNTNDMLIDNIVFNNTNNAASTAISNSAGSDNGAYLTIIGNTIIDPSYGTAINNNGTLTLGTNEESVGTTYEFGYTGHQEEFVAPETGLYKLETWGASSGRIRNYSYDGFWLRGGFGGYASGNIYLNAGDKLYIHVGQAGTYGDQLYGTYNGGGRAGAGGPNHGVGSSGGGATDISLSNEDNAWSYDNGVSISKRSNASYEQRIVVAGGGGVCRINGGYQDVYYPKYDICSGGYAASVRLGYADIGGGGGYYGGSEATGGSSYVSDTLTNAIMFTGDEEMPDYSSSGIVKGNIGNGYAKITVVTTDGENVTDKPTISAVNYGITGSGRIIYRDGVINANTAVNSDISVVPNNYDIYNSLDSNSKERMILIPNSDSRPVAQGEESYVAAIGNAKYTTIQNALDASNNGDEIDLLVNIEQQNMIIIPENKIITIDYNGHTVKSYNDQYLYKNLGNLTITDSTNSLNKSIFNGDKYIYNEGTLNVDHVYISNNSYNVNIIQNNEGTVTLDSVKLDFGNSISSKVGITNSLNGTLTIKNSTLNLYNQNNMVNNLGTFTLKDNTISVSSSASFVVNEASGNAVLDGNSYSVSGNDNNGRYFLNNILGTAIIKNMNSGIEDIVNTGTLTLEDNNMTSGAISSSGLLIINSGTYDTTVSITGTGLSIDDTDNLYSLIMHDGTVNKTISRSTTGITNIEGGTIEVTSGYAISNTSTGVINLGIHDGYADVKENTRPVITGKTYGIYTSNPSLIVNFYDGIITGQKSYNVTIEDVEIGYSIHLDYDKTNDLETKYLTTEPMFINETQNIEYDTIGELNTALSNGSVNNGDVIKVYRNITITKNDSPILIPDGIRVSIDLDGKIIDKNNATMLINNGEVEINDGQITKWNNRVDEIRNSMNIGDLEYKVYDYSYTGSYKKFVAPADGLYKVELWGASGGGTLGGKGAYTSGEVELNQGDTFYVYVGQGSSGNSSTFNGGGSCGSNCSAGGGASDIRLVNGAWNSSKGLASRIMVAAGGAGYNPYRSGYPGGAGGALTGIGGSGDSPANSLATQTAGAISSGNVQSRNGQFGIGGSGDDWGGGGSGGYWGGSGGKNSGTGNGGTSGTSYISGYPGCIAIKSTNEFVPKDGCDENSNNVECSTHYSGVTFNSPIMKAGNEEMPNYIDESNMTGNEGNGHARITILSTQGPSNYPLDDAIEYLNSIGEFSPEDTDSLGIITSTIGKIFDNNGTLNILSGRYISNRDVTEAEIILNNENATVNISGGSFTKYYDNLKDTSQLYRGFGSVIINSGNVNVTGGSYLVNSSMRTGYWWGVANFMYSSNVFYNNETGVINASNMVVDGFPSQDIDPTTKDYTGGTSYDGRGEYFTNKGVLNISDSVSKTSLIGENTGTVVMENVTMDNISYVNHYYYNNKRRPLVNSGTFTIKGGTYLTQEPFVNTGTLIITEDSNGKGTTIRRTASGITYALADQSEWTIYAIYNSGSGNIEINKATILADSISTSSAITNDSTGYVKVNNSTLKANNYPAIANRSSGTIEVYGDSLLSSNTTNGIENTSSGIVTIGQMISVDGGVSQTNPVIRGNTYGISNSSSGTLNFYDGIIEGKTNPVAGVINNIEPGYMILDGTDDVYKTNYLDRIEVIQNITQATPSDEKKYYDLKTAFDEANDGDILQMIANYSNLPDDLTAVNEANVTLDLNGKFIRQSNNQLLTNNATLNLIDSSEDKTGNIIAVTGSKVIDNYGTIIFTGGQISTGTVTLIIKNNTGSTLTIKDEAKINASNISTLIDNDGTLNIYNGAYLHNIAGSSNCFRQENYGLPMIINRDTVNVIDFNNDDNENTSSTYNAPQLHSAGISVDEQAWWFPVGYTNSIINNKIDSTVTIYGGIFNNGNNSSPDTGKILYNEGTVVMKNMDSYAFMVGYNRGTLTIENSTFHNFQTSGLTSVDGSLIIKNTTINFYQTSFASSFNDNNTVLRIGNATLDNITFTGGQHTNIGDRPLYMMDTVGTVNIKDSSINVISERNVIRNSGNLTITNTPINVDKVISNSGTLTLDNSNVTVTNDTGISNSGTLTLDNSNLSVTNGVAISSSGTVNLTPGISVTTTSGNAINTSGTLNVPVGVTITTQNGIGINVTGGATTIGEMGGVPDQTSPYIEGSTYGIVVDPVVKPKLYFYDGLIVCETGIKAISGEVYLIEGGYDTRDVLVTDPDTGVTKHNEYLVLNASAVAIAKVGTVKFMTNSETSSGQALQLAVDYAIGDGTNIQVVDLVSNVDLINDEVSIVASEPVTINANGFTINRDSTYGLSSNITFNTNNLGGSVSKLLGDVFDINNNPKNILVYEMSDGSILDTSKTYKLYRDGKVIGLEKEELGRYRYKGDNEELIPIKGRLYLDNLNKGSYKLLSSDNKSIEFSIDSDGNISGNVTEAPINKAIGTEAISTAELILQIQTGVNKHYYLLLIIPMILITLIMMILVGKNRKREI